MILCGLVYLKEEKTDTYNKIFGIEEEETGDSSPYEAQSGEMDVNKSESDKAGTSEQSGITKSGAANLNEADSDGNAAGDREPDSVNTNSSEADNQERKADITGTPKAAKDNDVNAADTAEWDINTPITESLIDSLPQEELQDAQKADMVPVEGTGEEVDKTEITTESGEEPSGNYSFPELMYPYRAMLNTEEQSVYDQVYSNAVNYNADPFVLDTDINVSQLNDIMMAVYNDHPELFWVQTQYEYQYGNNHEVYSIKLIYNETVNNISDNMETFNQRVNEIVRLADEYETDAEKELFVHDYLIQRIQYNERAPMNQSAFSALVNGESVCAGYSRAFQHIMMQLNIPTYYCTGVADGGPHAWNIIKLEDNYYNVDSLWDDSIGEQFGTMCHLYFNIPDSDFNIEHRRTGLSLYLPDCIGTDMTYEAIFGYVGYNIDSYLLAA